MGWAAQKTTQKILDILRKEPQITRKSLSEKTGLSEDGIKYHLARLEKVADKWRDATFEFIERQARIYFRYDKKRKWIEHVGADKGGRWVVVGEEDGKE